MRNKWVTATEAVILLSHSKRHGVRTVRDRGGNKLTRLRTAFDCVFVTAETGEELDQEPDRHPGCGPKERPAARGCRVHGCGGHPELLRQPVPARCRALAEAPAGGQDRQYMSVSPSRWDNRNSFVLKDGIEQTLLVTTKSMVGILTQCKRAMAGCFS